MKLFFSIVLVVFFFCSCGSARSMGQNLTEEDIAAIVDAITVRVLETQMLDQEIGIHKSMDSKLDRIIENQAGFQSFVKAHITQEQRRQAIRDVLAEFQPTTVRTVAHNSCGHHGRRGLFAGLFRF